MRRKNRQKLHFASRNKVSCGKRLADARSLAPAPTFIGTAHRRRHSTNFASRSSQRSRSVGRPAIGVSGAPAAAPRRLRGCCAPLGTPRAGLRPAIYCTVRMALRAAATQATTPTAPDELHCAKYAAVAVGKSTRGGRVGRRRCEDRMARDLDRRASCTCNRSAPFDYTAT